MLFSSSGPAQETNDTGIYVANSITRRNWKTMLVLGQA